MFAPTGLHTRSPGPKRKVAFAAALVASTVGLAACGSSHHATAGTPNSPDTIVIKNFAFQPSTLTVSPGAKVTVRNEDPATHTVTAGGSTKAFDTGDIGQGATVTFTAPSSPGSYAYICRIHQFMHGELQVR